MSEGYPILKLLEEMRETQKKDSALLITLVEHSTSVDKHLEKLNSKVATNVKEIAKNDKAISHFRIVTTTVATVLGLLWTGITFILR